MLIAVNTRFLLKDKLEGIGWFTYETMRRITQNHPEHRFLFLFDREPDPSFIFSDNIIPIKVWPPARHPFLWKWWFDFSLPRIFRKYKPDIFLSTDGFLSLRTGVPSILVIHDLGFEHFPQHTPPVVSNYYRKFTPKYARKADRIITVSAFSKRDIVQHYNVDPAKINVAYNGASNLYVPLPESERRVVREKFTGGSPYFIYVGSVHPRKNVDNLLLAFDRLKQQQPVEQKLLIAGRMAWKTEETKAIYEQMQFKKDVIFTGHLQLSDLTGVMASADALVYPSLFEGFGIPVVEARYCGVPVITSDRSSLAEVGGANAIYFDPENIEDIKNAMVQFLSEKEHYTKCAQVDTSAREIYNWDRTAEVIYNAIKEVEERNVIAK